MTSSSVLPTVAAVAVAFLAGCSDDGGSLDGPRPTNEELIAERNALREEASALGLTDVTTLPTSGSASYEGVMAFDLTGGEIVEGQEPRRPAGELELEVDFGRSTDAISGSAGNFVNYNGEEFDGSLQINDGDIDRDAVAGPRGIPPTYEADFDGTLTNQSGGDYAFDGEMNGYFHGTNPDYVTGNVDGTWIGPDGGSSDLDGNYAAER